MKPKDFDVDFATFLRNAGTMMPGWESEKWIDKLNPTYRQKLIRRLYGYYMMRRSKYDGLAEQSPMVRRTWPDIFSSMEDEQVPRLEKTRRIRVALNQD